MKQIKTLLLSFFLLMFIIPAMGQRVVTSNTIFEEGGFTYEFWMDAGGGYGTMTTGPNGTFKGEWKNVFNILFRSGLRPGSLDKVITYSATFEPYGTQGTSYLTLYGWTRNPLVEYYVVESWWNWRPPGGTPLGTVYSDGGIYDIYRTERVNKPSIDGIQTFPQFFSVRQEERTSGTITLANHIAAWKKLGMHMGADLYEVSFCVEGFRNNGNAHVYELSFANGAAAASSTHKQNYDGAPKVMVYNDPSDNNMLNFRFHSQPCTDASINIYSALGVMVQSLSNPELFTQFELATLSPGVYKVEVNAFGHFSNHRLVVR